MNKLIIAAAGSGKTTYLVNQALSIKNENILITTYTEANEEEIKKKFIEIKGYIPENITIQTWFSFLLQHGIRPFQSIMNDELHNRKIGFYLAEGGVTTTYKGTNGKTYSWSKERNFYNYYFTSKAGLKICSDTMADFIVDCNKKSRGEVINRISKIYPNIFIDEVQDLAGWELEIIKLFFKSSSNILLVGDPRQVTYLTHHPKKYGKYKNGKIEEFITNECRNGICEVDSETLNKTHRNNKFICDYSSKLFPEYSPCEPCDCEKCRNYSDLDDGIFLVKEKNIEEYLTQFPSVILKARLAKFPEWNFGKSKGLTFDNVVVYPTSPIIDWMKDNDSDLAPSSRCKFYVAITRAKYRVAIVYDYQDHEDFDGLLKWKPKEEQRISEAF